MILKWHRWSIATNFVTTILSKKSQSFGVPGIHRGFNRCPVIDDDDDDTMMLMISFSATMFRWWDKSYYDINIYSSIEQTDAIQPK